MQYIVEQSVVVDRYHSEGLQDNLRRWLPTLLPAVVDEVALAVKDHVGASENGMLLFCCAFVCFGSLANVTMCRMGQCRDSPDDAENRCSRQQSSNCWASLVWA